MQNFGGQTKSIMVFLKVAYWPAFSQLFDTSCVPFELIGLSDSLCFVVLCLSYYKAFSIKERDKSKLKWEGKFHLQKCHLLKGYWSMCLNCF